MGVYGYRSHRLKGPLRIFLKLSMRKRPDEYSIDRWTYGEAEEVYREYQQQDDQYTKILTDFLGRDNLAIRYEYKRKLFLAACHSGCVCICERDSPGISTVFNGILRM